MMMRENQSRWKVFRAQTLTQGYKGKENQKDFRDINGGHGKKRKERFTRYDQLLALKRGSCGDT